MLPSLYFSQKRSFSSLIILKIEHRPTFFMRRWTSIMSARMRSRVTAERRARLARTMLPRATLLHGSAANSRAVLDIEAPLTYRIYHWFTFSNYTSILNIVVCGQGYILCILIISFCDSFFPPTNKSPFFVPLFHFFPLTPNFIYYPRQVISPPPLTIVFCIIYIPVCG